MTPEVVGEWIAALTPVAGPLLLGAVWAVVARIVRKELITAELERSHTAWAVLDKAILLLPLPAGVVIGLLGAPVPQAFGDAIPAALWWASAIVPMWFVRQRVARAYTPSTPPPGGDS